jgi:hypothetical protein
MILSPGRCLLFSTSFKMALLFSLAATGCGQAKKEPTVAGIHGTLRMRIASYDDHAETLYRLVTQDGETLHLDFRGSPPNVAPGTEIAVRGLREGSRMQVEGFDVVLTDIASAALEPDRVAAPRTLKTALIVVDPNYAITRGRQRLLTAPDSPAGYFKDNSYGDWTIEGDVFGPYAIDTTRCATTDVDKIAADAQAAATAAGVDLSPYDNFMHYLPSSAPCGWSGLAEVGTNPTRGFKNGKNTWYHASDGCVVFAQELAHNLGLLHAHRCTAPPYASTDYGNPACAGFTEYGDPYSPMGSGCGHFSAMESGTLGFFAPCNTITVAASGTFEIGPIETRCSGPQVLRMAGAASVNQGPQYIYVEYRKGRGTIASDTRSLPGVYVYASAEYGGNLTNTVDPDTRYAVDPFTIHAPLALNATWAEPTSGVTFKVVAMGDTATVDLTFASGGTAAPKCIDGTPAPAAPMCSTIVGDGGIVGVDAGAGRDGGGAGGAAGAAGNTGASGGGGRAGIDGGTGGGGASTVGAGGNGGASASGVGGMAVGGSTSAGASGVGGSAITVGAGGSSVGAGPANGSSAQDTGCGCHVPGGTQEGPTARFPFYIAALLLSWLRRAGVGARRSSSGNSRSPSNTLPPPEA